MPSDGPSKLLSNVIEAYNYNAPDSWNGVRNLD